MKNRSVPDTLAKHANTVMAGLTVLLVLTGIAALYISKDSEKRQLRAYVYATPGIENFTIGQRSRISVLIRNDGQTPAYNFNVAMHAQSRPYPQQGPIAGEGIKPVPTSPTGDGIGNFAYKEHEIEFSLPQDMSPLITDAMYAGTGQRLYVWGRVLYLDAFQDQHHLNFCFTITEETVRRKHLSYCQDYNDAD